MSESINPNLTSSGVPIKNIVSVYDFRDSVYKGLQVGHFTSGTTFITGSSVQVVAANTTGTFQCHPYAAKKAVFVNQRSPMYRVYKTAESGNTAYLNWLPVNSGGWNNRVEFEGITNLSDLTIQTDSTSTTSVSGVVICYS